jgi:beta-N-acetylhexosaminidase
VVTIMARKNIPRSGLMCVAAALIFAAGVCVGAIVLPLAKSPAGAPEHPASPAPQAAAPPSAESPLGAGEPPEVSKPLPGNAPAGGSPDYAQPTDADPSADPSADSSDGAPTTAGISDGATPGAGQSATAQPAADPLAGAQPDAAPPAEAGQDGAASADSQPAGPASGDAEILALMAGMSLREKICQMLFVLPDAITGVSGTTVAGQITKAALEKYPVGGLLLSSGNIASSDQVALFNDNVQKYSRIGLFIASDEEGGRVGRLKSSIGAHGVRAMFEYRDAGEDTARANAVTLSQALKKHGFNMDMAPVADVWSNPKNTVIGDRAYSDSYEQAAALVAAAVRGFRSENVICALKHFPGHGSTDEDSHSGSAYVGKALGELRREDLLPFASGIASGADMVMLGHLTVEAIDSRSATMSRALATDLLRGELGFGGVVITDALNMNAVTDRFTAGEAAVGAVQAGADVLLAPESVEKALAALEGAVADGELSESRIDESVYRILSLKAAKGIV